jgi:hypothetical protein
MKPSLSFGFVGGRPVFMDEQEDSYFTLDEPGEAEFLDRLKSDGTISPVGSTILRASLGLPGEAVDLVFARPQAIVRSLVEDIQPITRACIRDVLRATKLVRHIQSSLARRPIAAILSELTRAERECRSAGASEVAQEAVRFIAARRIVPCRGNCLTDSLALIQWLGIPAGALLVFAVKLEPFAAHCWVQIGDLLLNDLTETAAQFQPVRVIECALATQ